RGRHDRAGRLAEGPRPPEGRGLPDVLRDRDERGRVREGHPGARRHDRRAARGPPVGLPRLLAHGSRRLQDDVRSPAEEAVIVHLVDGTYELFRHFYGLRRAPGPDAPLGAVRGVLGTVLETLEKGGTHLGVATDHVIESFRNG